MVLNTSVFVENYGKMWCTDVKLNLDITLKKTVVCERRRTNFPKKCDSSFFVVV